MQIFALEKVIKIRKFYANIRSKTTFVQMVLNKRKSIFEFYREKNDVLGCQS